MSHRLTFSSSCPLAAALTSTLTVPSFSGSATRQAFEGLSAFLLAQVMNLFPSLLSFPTMNSTWSI
jgi:hypothetical protein